MSTLLRSESHRQSRTLRRRDHEPLGSIVWWWRVAIRRGFFTPLPTRAICLPYPYFSRSRPCARVNCS